MDTPLYRALIGAPPDGELPGPAPNPTGRLATAAEIASYVAYLLSDEAMTFWKHPGCRADSRSAAGAGFSCR